MLLSDCHLLITRPQAQAQTWAAQLKATGASVTLQAMMSIELLTDSGSERAIINHMLAFADYHKAIFISQNAVSYGLTWLDKYWPQMPVGVELFAIGKSTANRLQQSIDDGMLYCAQAAMNTEALLSHPALQHLEDKKILIFRGQGGRTVLAEQLRERGATVAYCELYKRVCPPSQALDTHYRHTHKQPITVTHSGETLDNLCSILPPDDLLWLQQQPLLLPGLRVAKQAEEAGFQQIITAENATHESMVAALEQALVLLEKEKNYDTNP